MKTDALNFGDVEAVRTWLDGLEAMANDVIGVAQDQTRPLAHRDLGRAEAIRILTEAENAIDGTIAFARRGLPAKP